MRLTRVQEEHASHGAVKVQRKPGRHVVVILMHEAERSNETDEDLSG